MLAPSPESPAVRLTPRGNLIHQPRVGMFVSNPATNEDDDDVSVLTFHTLGTKDAVGSPLDNSNRCDDKNRPFGTKEEGIKKSLSHISEESERSRDGYKVKKQDENDDESLSLAETVLDSTNKLLSSIGSSSYYSGLNTKLKVEEQIHAQDKLCTPAKPNAKHPSPMKLGFAPEKHVFNEKDDKVSNSTNFWSSRMNFKGRRSLLPEKSLSGREIVTESSTNNRLSHQSEYTRSHQENCYDEEGDENFNKFNFRKVNYEKSSRNGSKDKMLKIEAETRQLQLLLREKQLETKLAMSELDASIQRASNMLE